MTKETFCISEYRFGFSGDMSGYKNYSVITRAARLKLNWETYTNLPTTDLSIQEDDFSIYLVVRP